MLLNEGIYLFELFPNAWNIRIASKINWFLMIHYKHGQYPFNLLRKQVPIKLANHIICIVKTIRHSTNYDGIAKLSCVYMQVGIGIGICRYDHNRTCIKHAAYLFTLVFTCLALLPIGLAYLAYSAFAYAHPAYWPCLPAQAQALPTLLFYTMQIEFHYIQITFVLVHK